MSWQVVTKVPWQKIIQERRIGCIYLLRRKVAILNRVFGKNLKKKVMFEKDEEIRSMDIWEVSISRKGNSNARQESSWDICEMAGGQMVNVK